VGATVKIIVGADGKRIPPSAWENYLTVLIELHDESGSLSSQAIRRRAGSSLSRSTINDVIKGRRMPSWQTLRKIVEGIDPTAIPAIYKVWAPAFYEAHGGRRTVDTEHRFDEVSE
jgi:hypothetical protein